MAARREDGYAFWKTIVTGVLVFGLSIGVAEVIEKMITGSGMTARYVIVFGGYAVLIAAVAAIVQVLFRLGFKNGLVLGFAYFAVFLFLNWLLRQVY